MIKQRRIRIRHLATRITACLVLLLTGRAGAGQVNEDATAADYNAQGVQHYREERWEDAMACFEEAYRLAPDHPTIRRNLCNTYQALANELAKKGHFVEAAEYLETAVSIEPENPMPLIQLGSCYLRLNHVAQAIYRLEEAIDLDPENADGHDLLGDAYYRDGDLPSALAQWQWVEEVQPHRKGLKEKLDRAYREESVERNYNRRGSRHFQVKYAPGTTPSDLTRALTTLERAYGEIGRKVGGVFPPGPIEVKVYTTEDFSKVTLLGEHVGAVYDGTIKLPIVDKSGQVLDSAELARRLYHEYTHVVVRHIVGDNVPWWLNEGLAEVFSNGLSAADVQTLQQVYQSGNAFSIADLQEHQLLKLPPDALQIAYLQGHATVQHLWNRYGRRPLLVLLNHLAEGASPEQALREAYGHTYAKLDKEVAASYRP